jgi:hypothetical protein
VITAANVFRHLVGWRTGLSVSFPIAGPYGRRVRVVRCLPEVPSHPVAAIATSPSA